MDRKRESADGNFGNEKLPNFGLLAELLGALEAVFRGISIPPGRPMKAGPPLRAEGNPFLVLILLWSHTVRVA